MSATVVAWLALRILRWALWFTAALTFLYIHMYRASMVDTFDHLSIGTEVFIYFIGSAPIFVGFFEMMARERAGVPKPITFGRWSLQPAPAASK